MADARDCGAVRITVPRLGSGNFGESGGYAIPTEQSDQVLEAGRRDIVHQVPGIGRYR